MKLHVELFLHTSIKNIVVVHKGISNVFTAVIYTAQKVKSKYHNHWLVIINPCKQANFIGSMHLKSWYKKSVIIVGAVFEFYFMAR